MNTSTQVPPLWLEIASRIAEFRTQRATTVFRAAERLGMTLPAEAPAPRTYALLHHYTYAISSAARAGRFSDADELVLRWKRADEEDAVEVCSGQRVAVVAADACRRSNDDRYESPLYLHVNPGQALSSEDAGAESWREAGKMIEAAGMHELVTSVTGVVVTLRERGHRETTNSYALKGLPGTIFVDYVADPVRLGELVLHESAHSLLNDALAAFDVQLSPEARWFSPWKQAYRPAYGILHAGFAFGVLQKYFDFHGTRPSNPSLYARVRAEIGAKQWDEARNAVTQALAEVTDPRAAALLQEFVG